MAIVIKYNGVEVQSEAFGINLRRGRNRQLDEFEPVSGSVMFYNFTGSWTAPFLATPSYLLLESGDFMLQENGDKILLEQSVQSSGSYGQIELGGTLTIDDGAVRVFTGHVEDINYQYRPDGYTDAQVILGDGLTTLANSELANDVYPPDDELPGDRLHRLMDLPWIALPAENRDFEKGTDGLSGLADPGDVATTDLTGTITLGTNALQYSQLVSRSEHGKFYIDRNGMVTFKGRYDFPSATPVLTVDDSGSNIPFANVDIDYGSELLRSSVTVQRAGGTPRSAKSDLDLPDALGERNLTISGLLIRFDPVCEARARFLVNQYAAVDPRVAGLRILLDGLSTSDRADVAGLDINDTITWTWTPPGTDTEVSQDLVIEGVTFVAELYGNTYVDLQLSSYPNTNFFIIGTDTLDGGVPLGF